MIAPVVPNVLSPLSCSSWVTSLVDRNTTCGANPAAFVIGQIEGTYPEKEMTIPDPEVGTAILKSPFASELVQVVGDV
jgi:hypothetical protein